jgi:hypothetical protein
MSDPDDILQSLVERPQEIPKSPILSRGDSVNHSAKTPKERYEKEDRAQDTQDYLSAPNKTAAQVGEKAGWLRAMGSSRRSA